MEINKIFVAIVATVIIVVGIGKISDLLYKTEQPDQVAYKVDAPEGSDEIKKTSESTVDLSGLMALADLSHGQAVFKKCKSCHSIKKGGKNNIGPALYDVMTRNSGGLTNYKYSKALISHAKKWTFEELNGFLLKPKTWIPNNKMGFIGLKNDKDRASVILYLNQNSDNPRPLP
tara:strand:+ start:19077 stop:19598 length:522 start_codon:yes stop_codon:yes gene_type:complete